ncbi:unnamed protein product [Bursaphelenchus okinawaensis]|uniref:G_PROTEIN_RECEP_F1_2 domain-containing protein n=1 Tax=Bursaphelenchus okinawaensis TaxID=465554 RepID=A0A811KW06_9BILA|nr:unnamed protein product [Bursaphelenchus okinawaensis]CAG9113117.1 unnamed protein product [Bursaphelenchus okinawaensis]
MPNSTESTNLCQIYLTYIEITVNIITMILNCYFTLRISQLPTFNANFRYMMVFQTFMTCTINFIHPLESLTPVEFYSLEAGNIKGSVFFYTLIVIQHFATFVFESKYMLIAIERVIAYRERATYENRDSTLAKKILLWFALLCIFILFIKTQVLWNAYSDFPVDVRLRRSLMIGRSYYGYCFNYIIAVISIAVAVFFFYKIHVDILEKHEYSSLSENFEVRQTKMVLAYMKSLVKAFFVLLAACGTGVGVVTYYKFVVDVTEDHPFIVTTYTCMFISLCFYNLASILYMIRSFPPLRRAILKDLPCLRERRVSDSTCDKAKMETEQYFSQLKVMWK